MLTLAKIATFLLLAATTVLASPMNAGGPALFARRASSTLSARTADDVLPQTNAARLARGLNPLKPKLLFTPSRVRRATTSAVPGNTYTGGLGVYSGGTLLGYLDPNLKVGPANTAASFRYTQPTSASTGVEIFVAGSPTLRIAPSIPYNVDLTGGLRPGSSASGTFSLVDFATAPIGSLSIGSNNQLSRFETPVFLIDPTTFATSVKWWNSFDGSIPTTYIVSVGGTLYLTGDVAGFKASNSAYANAVVVTLSFAPQ